MSGRSPPKRRGRPPNRGAAVPSSRSSRPQKTTAEDAALAAAVPSGMLGQWSPAPAPVPVPQKNPPPHHFPPAQTQQAVVVAPPPDKPSGTVTIDAHMFQMFCNQLAEASSNAQPVQVGMNQANFMSALVAPQPSASTSGLQPIPEAGPSNGRKRKVPSQFGTSDDEEDTPLTTAQGKAPKYPARTSAASTHQNYVPAHPVDIDLSNVPDENAPAQWQHSNKSDAARVPPQEKPPKPKPKPKPRITKPAEQAANITLQSDTSTVIEPPTAKDNKESPTQSALAFIEERLELLLGITPDIPESWADAHVRDIYLQCLKLGIEVCNARTERGALAVQAVPVLTQLAKDFADDCEARGLPALFTVDQAADYALFISSCIFRPYNLMPLAGRMETYQPRTSTFRKLMSLEALTPSEEYAPVDHRPQSEIHDDEDQDHGSDRARFQSPTY